MGRAPIPENISGRENRDAEAAAAAKQVPYVDPFAKQTNPSDAEEDRFRSEDGDWGQSSELPRERGRNRLYTKPDAQGWRTRTTAPGLDIYVVKLPDAPKPFFSGCRVSAGVDDFSV